MTAMKIKPKKSWFLWAVVGLIAGGMLAWQTRRTVDATVVDAPTASIPADNLSPEAEAAALAERCRETAAALQTRLDPTFSVLVEPPFVAAGNMRKADLAAHLEQAVLRPAAAMRRAYFTGGPGEPITVLLLTDRGVKPGEDRDPGYAYRGWAEKLFGDRDVGHHGYYKAAPRTMVMNIDTGDGTLVHELTHALIAEDFPHPPDWFNEALATLHEQCRVEEDDIIGLPNWRLAALREAVEAGTLRPLADLVTKDDFRGPLEGMNYAQARYFAMYMQHRGKLRDFYAHYRTHRENAAAAIEHVLGERIDVVENAFIAWVGTLQE